MVVCLSVCLCACVRLVRVLGCLFAWLIACVFDSLCCLFGCLFIRGCSRVCLFERLLKRAFACVLCLIACVLVC